MSERLEAYLEEIGHFLSGREEREEILSEIRSHILEKAEEEYGAVTDDSLNKVIAAYGPARRVAARYVDGHPIIAPVYKRFLFRYTAFLFACHFLFTLAAVVFRESFIMFPFLFVPRMGPFEAVLYLPTAFLFDLGVVTLVLYFITRSGKDVKLPWPRFSVDIDEVKTPKRRALNVAGAVVMSALAGLAIYVFVTCRTIFLLSLNFGEPKPLFTPEVGYQISLIVVAMLVAWALAAIVRLFTASRWVDATSNGVSLVLIGLLLRQPFDAPFVVSSLTRMAPSIKTSLKFSLLFIALFVAIDLVKGLVAIGRGKLAKTGPGGPVPTARS